MLRILRVHAHAARGRQDDECEGALRVSPRERVAHLQCTGTQPLPFLAVLDQLPHDDGELVPVVDQQAGVPVV